MKKSFFLFLLALWVGTLFYQCKDSSADKAPAGAATVAAIPDPFIVKVFQQGSVSANGIPARAKKNDGAPIDDLNNSGIISISQLAEGDRVNVESTPEPGVEKDHFPIEYTFNEADYLDSMKAYLKLSTADTGANGQVKGFVFNQGGKGIGGIKVALVADSWNLTATTDSTGKFDFPNIVNIKPAFEIKFSGTQSNEVQLKVSGVKDSLQLDVYMDDGFKDNEAATQDTSQNN